MPHPNVTIRHARHAVHLLMMGAVADIDAEFAGDDAGAATAKAHHVELFDGIASEMDMWELEETRAWRVDCLVSDMQAMLGAGDNCPTEVRELLAKYGLEP